MHLSIQTESRLARVLAAMGALMLAGCSVSSPAAPGSQPAGDPPPLHQSEGVVVRETAQGPAAVELVATPAQVTRTGQVTLRLHNRGDVRLVYGRPVVVERWEQHGWVETNESRNSAWTLEALFLDPHQAGVDQRWPFPDGHVPAPGWYRFTKTVQADAASGDPETLVVRARVRVTGD